jgi:flagellar biosynthesis anti-sigma factor FlgM
VKIEPNNQQKPAGSPPIHAPRPGHPAASTFDGSANPVMHFAGDHLVLSARLEEFHRMRPRLEALSASPNADRVAELRRLIARGVYAIDARAVAEAMLDDEAVARALEIQ